MNDQLGLSPARATILLVLCAVIGGVAALFAILICYFMLNFGGHDAADKHGISSIHSIRIGGVLIVVYLLFNLLFQHVTLGLSALDGVGGMIVMVALPFFMLGFYEDLKGLLSARFRFIAMLALAFTAVILDSRFVILPLGDWLLDALVFNHPAVALVFSALCLAFLPNAFNTADGANGLVSGTSLIAVLALSQVAPPELVSILHSVAIACALFLVYNLVTGRFFLGDGGAYFLGALLATTIIIIANGSNISLWYLLALIFYPVADLIFSMIRRVLAGKSPFEADNSHLHNLIFAWLSVRSSRDKRANTITGLFIATFYAGTAFALQQTETMQNSPNAWFVVFCVFWSTYVLLWYWLHRSVCALNQYPTV
jgi:UDP-N-acetylmuramyl pentapeptide phosphotransferase/UDP-N-acetylglucosamine-1-phosphate transferase